MEGPTPISALIHAATMVTAGIFMVARFSPLFELSDVALSFIIVIGAIGALFLGILGIIQNDIKRVVAYSTLSQLGYMTVALGASAYSVAIFHLMTHAFFKALLFLGAGSVIIGMHHDQDIRNMGGLRKYMPITWITFLLGTLAWSARRSSRASTRRNTSSKRPAPPRCGRELRLLRDADRRVRDLAVLVPRVLRSSTARNASTPAVTVMVTATTIMATTTTAIMAARRMSRPGS